MALPGQRIFQVGGDKCLEKHYWKPGNKAIGS